MSDSTDAGDGIPAEAILDGIGRLLELGQSVPPIVVEPGSQRWWSASSGLIVRILTLAETIMHVSRLSRPSDLSILVRCLYEHVVVLAWIAAPRDDSRFEIWERNSHRTILAWANEMRDLGFGELTDETREWLDGQVSAGPRRMPSVDQLARQAEADWQDRLGLVGMNTMTASYSSVYRGGSAFAHPTALGLGNNKERVGDRDVLVVERRADISAVIGPAFTFLAVALVVSSHTIGRPPLGEIKAIVDRFADAAERR